MKSYIVANCSCFNMKAVDGPFSKKANVFVGAVGGVSNEENPPTRLRRVAWFDVRNTTKRDRRHCIGLR